MQSSANGMFSSEFRTGTFFSSVDLQNGRIDFSAVFI